MLNECVIYFLILFELIDVLGLSPAKEKFQKVLNSTLCGIPQILTSKAIAIDGSVPDKDSQEGDTARSERNRHPDK